MRKILALLIAFQLCVFAGTAVAAGNSSKKSTSAGKVVKMGMSVAPTQEGVLKLAEKYTNSLAPKLNDQDIKAYKEVKDTLAQNEFSDLFYKQALGNIISHLTLELASAKSLDGLTAASAYLVKKHPKNIRALNLFGSVLHTNDVYYEAIPVFQYTQSLDPKHVLTRLNLANAYLDANQDEKAKAILDKLEFEDYGNKAVYRALATYYWKKKNMTMFKTYLFKAAKFAGFKRKKADKKKEKVEQNEVKNEESTDAMEPKLKQLAETVPLTTADVLEEEYPDAASKIRNKYGKLAETEKWVLPKLPMVNLNGPPDFARNKPIVDAWASAVLKRMEVFPKRQAEAMGIDPNASDKVKEAQAKAAAKKKMQEAMQQAQQSLKYMENVPGISKAEIAEAKKELEKAAREANVKVEDKPVDKSAPPPGVDSGGLFSGENFYNYVIISTSYEKYFSKYYKEYNAKVTDILKVYAQKVKEEEDRWKKEWEDLQEEHRKAGVNSPHNDEIDQPCRRAQIEHKKRLNAISDNYYRQWSNLYMPQYAQKMKPTLDAYFKVCMLHVRNMNDPKVMEREYGKVTMMYSTYASQAVGGIGMGGGFSYHPETEEEERQLDQEVAKAKEEAEEKKEEFARSYQSPEFSFTQWIDDHFVLEISGEFLALKVSAKAIEFEAYVPGVGAGAKYDFSEEKFETYTGVGPKLEIGVNICGLEAKLEGKSDFYRRTATWDLKNGTYTETDSAKAEAKGSFGPLSAGAEFELDAQLNAKISSKISLGDMLTLQEQQNLN